MTFITRIHTYIHTSRRKSSLVLCHPEHLGDKSLLGRIFTTKDNRKKTAFTLAEVLITLGIIGIVAAMTIPTLINNSQERELTEALKKFYSDVCGAVGKINIESSYDIVNANTNDATSTITIRDALCEFLSCVEKGTVTQIFGSSLNHSDPNNTVYKNYKSTSRVYTDLSAIHGAAKLKNGMFFANHYFWTTRNSFQLYVDTNGAKGPNMFGKDLNMFEVIRDPESGNFKVIVEGSSDSHIKGACLTGQTTYNNVWPCSYYRLYEPDKLP